MVSFWIKKKKQNKSMPRAFSTSFFLSAIYEIRALSFILNHSGFVFGRPHALLLIALARKWRKIFVDVHSTLYCVLSKYKNSLILIIPIFVCCLIHAPIFNTPFQAATKEGIKKNPPKNKYPYVCFNALLWKFIAPPISLCDWMRRRNKQKKK